MRSWIFAWTGTLVDNNYWINYCGVSLHASCLLYHFGSPGAYMCTFYSGSQVTWNIFSSTKNMNTALWLTCPYVKMFILSVGIYMSHFFYKYILALKIESTILIQYLCVCIWIIHSNVLYRYILKLNILQFFLPQKTLNIISFQFNDRNRCTSVFSIPPPPLNNFNANYALGLFSSSLFHFIYWYNYG